MGESSICIHMNDYKTFKQFKYERKDISRNVDLLSKTFLHVNIAGS